MFFTQVPLFRILFVMPCSKISFTSAVNLYSKQESSKRNNYLCKRLRSVNNSCLSIKLRDCLHFTIVYLRVPFVPFKQIKSISRNISLPLFSDPCSIIIINLLTESFRLIYFSMVGVKKSISTIKLLVNFFCLWTSWRTLQWKIALFQMTSRFSHFWA